MGYRPAGLALPAIAAAPPAAPSVYNPAGPSVSGSGALPGATIQVFDGSTSLGTTTASSTGAWTLMLASALASGTHGLTARQTPVPVQSAASAALPVTVAATMSLAGYSLVVTRNGVADSAPFNALKV